MTKIIGRRPPQVVKRVAICPTGCEDPGRLGVIETELMTYTCECGEVVDTVLVNLDDLRRSVSAREREEFLDAADFSHAPYAPQLHIDPDEE